MTLGNVEGDPDHSLSSLILQGLACGTILYVAFFEILERERSKQTVGLLQWTLLLLGFLAIMGLQSQGNRSLVLFITKMQITFIYLFF